MAHELYNQLSKYTDASYRRSKNYQQEVEFILRRVGNTTGRKILIDVACGTGGHAERLSKAGFEVNSGSTIAAFLLGLRHPRSP